MRREPLGVGEYYHIYNRGTLKSKLFLDQRDWIRFLFSLLYFQSDITFTNISRPVSYFVKHRVFNIDGEVTKKIVAGRMVSLAAFALMPNHFHLLVQNIEDGGLSRYMQRVLNAYAKYFNTKYQRNGHLFQGPYQSVYVENNDQLLYLSAYIHKHHSIFSSSQDYTKNNRWGKLLTPDIVLGQFANPSDYKNWVAESAAKEPDYLR